MLAISADWFAQKTLGLTMDKAAITGVANRCVAGDRRAEILGVGRHQPLAVVRRLRGAALAVTWAQGKAILLWQNPGNCDNQIKLTDTTKTLVIGLGLWLGADTD